MGKVRSTVIIPSYGYAPYLRSAITSVQLQSVRELEICVVLDGSPETMEDMVGEMALQDERIRLFTFPKGPRTGEIHRAKVIPETTGKIICYLSHDDLWFSHHVAMMERLLAEADFGHSLHLNVGMGDQFATVETAHFVDLARPEYRHKMLDRTGLKNYFGLSYGAHSREAYDKLEEGWDVTPDGIYTDLHMWRKFLSAPWGRFASHMGVTALHFPKGHWKNSFTPDEMKQELDRYLAKMEDPLFREELVSQVTCSALGGVLDLQEMFRHAVHEEFHPYVGDLNGRISKSVAHELECRPRWATTVEVQLIVKKLLADLPQPLTAQQVQEIVQEVLAKEMPVNSIDRLKNWLLRFLRVGK